MEAGVSNGALRELVAERDYLKQRNIQLSESLDANAAKYQAILFSLGFDAEGNTLPKDESAAPPEGIGDRAGVDDAPPADAAEAPNPRKKNK